MDREAPQTIHEFHTTEKNRTIIKKYIRKVSGYSQKQLKRLIKAMKKTRRLVAVSSPLRASFKTKYTIDDVAFLVNMDDANGRLSGAATKELFIRAFTTFQDERALRLKDISIAHLYRLRGRRQYRSQAAMFTKTV